MLRYELILPSPVSVNKIWSYGGYGKVYRSRAYTKWIKAADHAFLVSGLNRGLKTIKKKCQVTVELEEGTRLDCDNGNKAILDYLQRVRIVENDKLAKKVTAFAGEAPKGQCRVIIEEI